MLGSKSLDGFMLETFKTRKHCGVTKKYERNSKRFPLKHPHQRASYNINKDGKVSRENIIKVKQFSFYESTTILIRRWRRTQTEIEQQLSFVKFTIDLSSFIWWPLVQKQDARKNKHRIQAPFLPGLLVNVLSQNGRKVPLKLQVFISVLRSFVRF